MEIDRSRIIAYQQCPRQRYLGYHIHGTGLQRKSKALPLQFGSAFHEGVEGLLLHEKVEEGVIRAHDFLEDVFAAHQIGFDNETPDDVQKAMEYGKEEQMALAEGLLRAWWAYEGKSFLENFEVLEVEQEGRAVLSDDLVLMFRPDALVRDRQSGDLYIVSWKTCATFGPRNVNQARHDMQSMSEVWGKEEVLKDREMEHWRIEGVLYKWIVKGSRRKDNYDGLYKQGSHLIYGWQKLGTGGGDDAEWSWAYEFTTEEGKTSRLGKGWKKVPIWREYPGGVKQWIEDLSKGEVFPRGVDTLGSVFPQALPVERREDEVESWKRQVVMQELDVADSVDRMSSPEYAHHSERHRLDVLFPQWTHSCHSYSGCPFIPICWEGAAAEPGELYQIRTANHPEKGEGDE
jgi:hypothetical protein